MTVLIAGAGIAGVSAAEKLRELSQDVDIILLNAEDRRPYKRTKLSKFLHSGFDKDQFALREPDWADKNRIQLLNGVELESVANKTAALTNGRTINFDSLILAIGTKPRTLADDYYSFRSAAQAEELFSCGLQGKRILIIGNGVMAVELCDQAVKAGAEVAVAAVDGSLMPSLLNDEASVYVRKLAEEAGVEVIKSSRDVLPEKNAGTYSFYSQEYDIVIEAIGMQLDAKLPEALGLKTKNGSIYVNDKQETSVSGIFAVGDCAFNPKVKSRGLWHAAEHDGKAAAYGVLGIEQPQRERLFRLKCEVFGEFFFSINMAESADCFALEDEAPGVYHCLYFRNDVLTAAVMYGQPERAKQYEKAVQQGLSIEDAMLSLALDAEYP